MTCAERRMQVLYTIGRLGVAFGTCWVVLWVLGYILGQTLQVWPTVVYISLGMALGEGIPPAASWLKQRWQTR